MASHRKYKVYKLIDGREKRGFLINMTGNEHGLVITDAGEIVEANTRCVIDLNCGFSDLVDAKMGVFERRVHYIISNGKYDKAEVKREWSRVFEKDTVVDLESAEEWLNLKLKGTGYKVKMINIAYSTPAAGGIIFSKCVDPSQKLYEFYLKAKLVGKEIGDFSHVVEVKEEMHKHVREVGVIKAKVVAFDGHWEIIDLGNNGEVRHSINIVTPIAVTEKGIKDFWEYCRESLEYKGTALK